MKIREAIGILMLSPWYWLMEVRERKLLISEFLSCYRDAVRDLAEREKSRIAAS